MFQFAIPTAPNPRALVMGFAFCIACIATLLPVHAQEPSFVAKSPLATIEPADIQADSLRLNPQNRQTAMSQPGNVRQIAQNLLVRRALAAEAVSERLDQDPLVAANLRIARDRVLSDARLAQIDSQNEPSEAAIEAYVRSKYQAEPNRFQAPAETRARHILIRDVTPASKTKAENILARLKAGEAFDALAKAFSEDPGSAARGGDLGFFPAGRMVKPFEDAVTALKNPGELSGLVETQFGYHIVQLTARREAGVRPFEEVKPQLQIEARSALLSEARVKKAAALAAQAQFDDAAIKAVADSFK